MGEPSASDSLRYTVRDAADILGISESAVRNRLSRGTLASERIEGVTYVVLAGVTGDIPPTDAPTDDPGEQDHDPRDELIAALREQLQAEREANRENRRLLAAALQMRELEAPPQSAQEAESAPRGGSREEASEERAEAQDAGERRVPWWRRLLGRNAGSR